MVYTRMFVHLAWTGGDDLCSISRHPSYAGFFYWAIATQLLLGNYIATIGFAVVLYRFFSSRIVGEYCSHGKVRKLTRVDEEIHLVRFFGDSYVEYRKRVGTGLPF